MPDEGTSTEELTLETVTAVEPDQLTDDQKTFLEENKDNLSDEQKEKYGYKEDESFKDDDAVPTARGSKAEKKDDDLKDGDKGDDDADIDEEDEKTIKKIVDKSTSKISQQLNAQEERIFRREVEDEVKSLIQSKPEYKDYEARIRRFVYHDNRIGLIRNGLPVEVVVAEALAPVMERIGAKKAIAANAAADTTKSNGSSQRKGEKGKIDYSKMSDEEITSIGDQVKSGRYAA